MIAPALSACESFGIKSVIKCDFLVGYESMMERAVKLNDVQKICGMKTRILILCDKTGAVLSSLFWWG